jgi:hypothetical protein
VKLKNPASVAILVLFAFFSLAQGVHANENKVALVIGNSAYETVPSLPNPRNDASDLAASLERAGFDVSKHFDLALPGMLVALRDYAEKSRDGDISVVYFAGHGIEIDKTNYLLPIDAELSSQHSIELEAVQLRTLLGAVATRSGVTVMLVDACRDNPFKERLQQSGTTRSIGRGLVRVNPTGGNLPGGILVAYAAKEGEYALDGVGRNSPFAEALLENIETPGLEISKLFRQVRDAVFERTAGLQEPFTYGSLPSRDVFLVPPVSTENNNLENSETIVRSYAIAQRENTLAAWTAFISRHGKQESNKLVEIARRNIALLQDEVEKDQERQKELPWLVPSGGIKRIGNISLNNNEIVQLQKSLSFMGFDPGTPDGKIGPKTRRAIAAARVDNGLVPGSQIDFDLLKVLPDPALVEALIRKESSTYRDTRLPDGLEPRLKRALEVLSERWLKFDYFEGHLYLVVAATYEHWQNASELADAVGGHLATISSAKENDFLLGLFENERHFTSTNQHGGIVGPFIGLYQADQSSEPTGGWVWVTGEPLNYVNWARGQPDNNQGRGVYGRFYSPNKSEELPSKWDDAWGPAKSFIIEIE